MTCKAEALSSKIPAFTQEKRAMDKNHEDVQRIYTGLVDECTKRPPSDEDANSIAGAWTLPHPLELLLAFHRLQILQYHEPLLLMPCAC